MTSSVPWQERLSAGTEAVQDDVCGPEVMRAQVDRLFRDIDLPSLTLGILPATARVSMFPVPGFGILGDGDTVNVELVSTGVDITDASEVALHQKAFALLREKAAYGDAAKDLIRKARSFWDSAPLQE
ncbi:Scr1 family TA system antitoxin-like transcriptional regulator [Streptomyces coeruleorubidus]|uniref:Scr1 family TA system antitoxin-like transcriptional regulator n=1 Tax=Streptomyces coeruleorubidus TaxID=116188 RepID=A0ABZ0KDP7_STRC4|nr:Scr1 family TA system antitoxin-like transcriptional regulator [Streptomyces coeruleorubidus]WOT36100.1 Scr1 family TA system antitoxin-like transcriptional regulator [Streptomyces coeruleorubidus]